MHGFLNVPTKQFTNYTKCKYPIFPTGYKLEFKDGCLLSNIQQDLSCLVIDEDGVGCNLAGFEDFNVSS